MIEIFVTHEVDNISSHTRLETGNRKVRLTQFFIGNLWVPFWVLF